MKAASPGSQPKQQTAARITLRTYSRWSCLTSQPKLPLPPQHNLSQLLRLLLPMDTYQMAKHPTQRSMSSSQVQSRLLRSSNNSGRAFTCEKHGKPGSRLQMVSTGKPNVVASL